MVWTLVAHGFFETGELPELWDDTGQLDRRLLTGHCIGQHLSPADLGHVSSTPPVNQATDDVDGSLAIDNSPLTDDLWASWKGNDNHESYATTAGWVKFFQIRDFFLPPAIQTASSCLPGCAWPVTVLSDWRKQDQLEVLVKKKRKSRNSGYSRNSGRCFIKIVIVSMSIFCFSFKISLKSFQL